MTAENDYRLGRRAFHQNQEESVAVALAVVTVFLLAGSSYILVNRFHVRSVQMVEGSLYSLFGLVACVALSWYLLTRRRRREAKWPHPPPTYKPGEGPRRGQNRIRALTARETKSFSPIFCPPSKSRAGCTS